jgi:ABC-2 type transport system permease protein
MVDMTSKTLAARVTGTPGDSENAISLIFVADLDMIGSEFFGMRRAGLGDTDIQFDNVTFILNCIDDLAGDSSFIDLRSRRPRHRTLERLEQSTQAYTNQWRNARNNADGEANSALAAAQRSFDEKVAAVEGNLALDAQSQAIRIQEIREVENRKLTNAQRQIERNKVQAMDRAEARMNQQRNQLQDLSKALTVGLTPMPAILVGLLVFSRKRKRRALGGAA